MSRPRNQGQWRRPQDISYKASMAALSMLCLSATATFAAAPGSFLPQQDLAQIGQERLDGSARLRSRATMSALKVTTDGISARHSLENQQSALINVKDFGAKGDGKADDSAAFAAGIRAQLARLADGIVPCLYAPAGIYLLKATPLPIIDGPGCIKGDGVLHTVFKIDPTYTGDVFSFSEAWPGGSFPFNGVTPNLTTQRGGPILRDFSIVGDRSTRNVQNAIVFYDRNEFLDMQDVDVDYIKGRALAFGIQKYQNRAFIQESRISRVRFLNDGTIGVPVVEFNAVGPAGTEGSGEVDVDTMDIYANYGPGLVIRNAARTHLAAMRFTKLRIEGLENNPSKTDADLLTIGDPKLTGVVDGLVFRQTELLDPYAGGAALRTTAPAAASMPYDIDFEGVIGGGAPAGKGLVIDSGRAMRFSLSDIYTEDTEVTVGAEPLVGLQIVLAGTGGRESSWTYNVDPTSDAAILSPILRVGNPGKPSTLGLALGRDILNKGEIKLEALDKRQGRVAGGSYAATVAGLNNTALGSASAIVGGSSNLVSAVGGSIVGSSLATDRGRIYSQAYSSGGPNGLGSGQAGRQALYASGIAKMRLTANGAPANSVLSPAMNIPPDTAFNLSIRLVAIDRTAPRNSYAKTIPVALMTRKNTIESTSLVLGKSDAPLFTGSGSHAGANAVADKASGTLDLTFIPPPQGSDTWDAFADVLSAEVR